MQKVKPKFYNIASFVLLSLLLAVKLRLKTFASEGKNLEYFASDRTCKDIHEKAIRSICITIERFFFLLAVQQLNRKIHLQRLNELSLIVEPIDVVNVRRCNELFC